MNELFVLIVILGIIYAMSRFIDTEEPYYSIQQELIKMEEEQ